MNSDDLMKIGKILIGKNFIGVFPLDKLPQNLTLPSFFIVNTHTANLPGEHWLAVAYIKRGTIHAFDSFGMEYPPALVHYLKRYGRMILNNRTLQSPLEDTCGMYVIRWLQQKKKESR